MIGNKIRELRESKGILLRQLAAQLEIDTAVLSKMERGDRFFKKDEILELSAIFKQDSVELLTLWLADRIVKTIKEEDHQAEALQLALNTINNS